MAERIKRITMFRADEQPFAGRADVLKRLAGKDLVHIGEDRVIAVFSAAAAEELDEEEREVVYRLQGYDMPDPATPLIAKRAGLVGGRAAVAATRIPVWQIAQSIRDGGSRRDLRMMTGLSDDQIDQALTYEKRHEEEISRDIFDNDLAARLAGSHAG